MKKRCLKLAVIGIMVFSMLTGCVSAPKKLSDDYITVENFVGVEIEKVEITDASEEDVDKVVARMMKGYTAANDLPEDTEITDEIVKETLSESAETVEDYRAELKSQIQEAKEKAAREEEEKRVWEKVMDNSEVKEYPEERLKAIKQNLVELYEGYAAEQKMEYEDYMKAIKLEDKDLDEAAEASLKQELVAEIIAEKYGLKPTEEEFQTALEDYAETYKFVNVELLLKAVPEEEMRGMVIRDNVRAWLTDRCKYVEASEEDKKVTEEAETEVEKENDNK